MGKTERFNRDEIEDSRHLRNKKMRNNRPKSRKNFESKLSKLRGEIDNDEVNSINQLDKYED